MSTLFEKYLPFLNTDEHFFVIETIGGVLRLSLLTVVTANKQVRLIKTIEAQVPDKPAEAFADAIPELLRQFRLPATVRIIALLDHRRATVLSGVISLMRSDPKAEIKQAELENLVSQGLWKMTGIHRNRAATKMEIPEVRVRLADADVVQVRLNGHRVVNPVGFVARSVELCFRETFVDAQLLARLGETLTEDNLAAVFEGPAVLAGLVARLHSQSEFLFVSVGARESVVYHVNQMVISYVDSFGWGTEMLKSGAAKQFEVDGDTIDRMLEQYYRREVSPAIRRALEAATSGELAMLSNGIAAHLPSGKKVPVYVHAALPLPSFLFDEAFSRRLGLSLTLTAVNERFIGEHTGFVVDLQHQGTGASQFTYDCALAAVADVQTASNSSVMSKAAKQRARWTQAGATGKG
jgi:hypothetical protein